jgi:hypothetical protein
MRATDLMVGDKLKTVFSKKIVEVKEIKQSCIYTEDNGYEYDEIEPIPLTAEILEKNGWFLNDEDEKFFPQTWVGGGLMLQGADDSGYCIVVTSDYDDEDTNRTPFILLYVHELQHALRLRRIEKEINL